MKQKLRQILPYLGCILLFVGISVAYFSPDMLEGKVLFQGDTQQGIAINQEKNLFFEATGEQTRWTNALFSGMPTYQSSPKYAIGYVIDYFISLYRLFLPDPAGYLFIMLLGFFILMRTLRVRKDLAVLGAIMYTFSSYFLILIEAGHLWKFITLAYIPPTIGGILLAYRGKYLAGGALAGLFATLQIVSNHVQMTYYFLFVILALVVGIFIDHVQTKRLPAFFKASGVLVVAALLAVGVNISNLFHTYQYSQQTMRGGSELVTTNSAETLSTDGLQIDYITQWSYGKAETMTFLIPNYVGGATGQLGKQPKALEKAKPEFREYFMQFNSYWGDQPFTSGPVYVGAFVLFLAILAMFIVKDKIKWALFAVTVLTIALAWGKNYLWLTELFVDYVPMYNKFRAVSSLLVVAEFTLPVLAILALKKIIEQPTILKEKVNGVYVATALTAGISLLAALMPDLFSSFMSSQEAASYLPQAAQQPGLMSLLENLMEGRKAIFTADAWRSFIIIMIGIGLLIAYTKNVIKANILVLLIGILVLGDLWSVDKRYLNSENFVSEQKLTNPFPMTAADKQILADKDPHYRVLNLSTNTFNDAATSYYHKSIGGYHAAKLQRYQDLIDFHMTQQITPQVINMLNGKYIITPVEGGGVEAQINEDALGNAWFVENVDLVDTPNEEIEGLYTFNPEQTAIINKEFAKGVAPRYERDSTASIKLTSYAPNEIRYTSENTHAGLAVFSEVYYPGWTATVDGKEIAILRADYILRALPLTAGTHEIVFTFKPQSIETTNTISFICFGILCLMGLVALAQYLGLISCKACQKGAKSKPQV